MPAWPAEPMALEISLLLHALLALLVGSFISMLSARLPDLLDADTPELMRKLAWDRSRCPHCHTPLNASDLIPLLSWLIHRGRARCCQTPISWRYPLIELATLLLSLLVVWQFASPTGWLGLSLQGWSALLLSWTLISISVIDFEHQLIPDRLSLPLLWLGLLANSLGLGFADNLQDAVWGAMLGYASLWLIYQTHRALTGREGMGYGDFKLTAALAAWLGWQALLPLFILSGSLAIGVMGVLMLVGRSQLAQAFPFGPWLAAAGMMITLWPDQMNGLLMQLLGG